MLSSCHAVMGPGPACLSLSLCRRVVLLCSLGPLGCSSTVLLRCRLSVLLRSPRAACRWRCFCCCPSRAFVFSTAAACACQWRCRLCHALSYCGLTPGHSCCGAVVPSGCCVVGKAWCLVTDYALQLMARRWGAPTEVKPARATCVAITSWQQPKAAALSCWGASKMPDPSLQPA
jgi:hypothetical protein